MPIPAPRINLASTGLRAGVAGIVAADIIVAAGDYTGGASEDIWTLTAHGLVSGDVIYCVWQSAMGGVTGGEETKAVVLVLSSSTFQLTTDGTTVIENTADCTAVFYKSRDRAAGSTVAGSLLPNLIVDAWDFTGGAAEDIGVASNGIKGLYEGDTIKLVYKSAAGVTAGTLNTTYYAKAPTVTYHQIAATNGGAVIDSTADGTAVFIKTS